MVVTCIAPQMILDRKGLPDRKWSPNWTTKDSEPQMIPDVDRKWSRWKNGMELGVPDILNFCTYLFIYLFVCFLFIFIK